MGNANSAIAQYSLNEAVQNLVKQILEYESDTFSASAVGLERSTAEQMAAWLIYNLLFDQQGFPGDCIDGAVIGTALDDVTEDED